MEIERQFLVDRLPQLPEEYELLRQGYVALLPEIRIRQIGDSRFWLTVKRGAGLVREESRWRVVWWQSCMCMQVILRDSIMWKWNFRMWKRLEILSRLPGLAGKLRKMPGFLMAH